MTREESVRKLDEFCCDMSNHKLVSLPVENLYRIVRRNKKWGFNINFSDIVEMGFEPMRFETHNGKDMLLVRYVNTIKNSIQKLFKDGVIREDILKELDYRENAAEGCGWDDNLYQYDIDELQDIEEQWEEILA